jgi:dihydrofolate reductase
VRFPGSWDGFGPADARTFATVRKIINSTYITLDGVIEAPHLWPSLGPPGDDRFGQIQTDLALSCDALLMGRHTYDGFAPVWPTRAGDPLSDHINAMPKYVASTTLKDPEWNNTHVIDGDVVAEVGRLKEAPGKDIVQYGYGAVSRLLLQHNLLDELRLWLHPLILGSGSPTDLLFGEAPAVGFRLTDATPLSDGIVILSYQTAETLDH